jgi:hypothetical protein
MSDLKLKIYPNPVSKNLHISSVQNIRQPHFIVSDITGKSVFEQYFSQPGKNFFIELPNLINGSYSITLMDGEELITVKKFQKQE